MTFIASKMVYWSKGADEGNRNNWLAAQVGFLIGQRMPHDEVYKWANIINQNFIKPPLDVSEIIPMVEAISSSEKYKKEG